MLSFAPVFSPGATVLCLGAHCDDVEIGCSGALIELQKRHPGLRFHWVVFSGDGVRPAETRAAAQRLLGGAPGCTVEILDFPASFFPTRLNDVKQAVEAVKQRVTPELIFTHYLHDRHQDHRVLAELSWNSFRNHAILEYEIPKYEGDLAQPNVYVPLSAESLERKVETLMDCFPSQHGRTWFDRDLFRGHLRLRGVECNAPSRYAEAFHARKFSL